MERNVTYCQRVAEQYAQRAEETTDETVREFLRRPALRGLEEQQDGDQPGRFHGGTLRRCVANPPPEC